MPDLWLLGFDEEVVMIYGVLSSWFLITDFGTTGDTPPKIPPKWAPKVMRPSPKKPAIASPMFIIENHRGNDLRSDSPCTLGPFHAVNVDRYGINWLQRLNRITKTA